WGSIWFIFAPFYHAGVTFTQSLSRTQVISIIWSPPPEALVLTYIQRGFSKEDATIAAATEQVQAEYLISENRDFLQRSENLSFRVINAKTALKLLPKQ
ncbi:MAG: hypothetical protein JW953_24560, partial [Anaerolineae bacterium]|nr:hypothetical protein [Anaerolineae bacterium]